MGIDVFEHNKRVVFIKKFCFCLSADNPAKGAVFIHWLLIVHRVLSTKISSPFPISPPPRDPILYNENPWRMQSRYWEETGYNGFCLSKPK